MKIPPLPAPTIPKAKRHINRWISAASFAAMMILSTQAPAQTRADEAKKIFKSMSDYLTAQNNLSATYDTDIEVITSRLQKIQFSSSGQLSMSRPDKLRVVRVGGYSEVELVFNGATATVLSKDHNLYAQLNIGGSVDQLVDRLRGEFGVAVPGADLLLARVFDQLTEDVVEATYIGPAVVDGIECDHLAFRNADTDWQLWVEHGPRPLPRKYVITNKGTTGAPQYTLRIKSWTTDATVNPEVFAFKAPAGAKMVDFKDLQDIDEVPPGETTGETK